MDILGAIIRGAVQGITEFLPISSDGHLVVIGHYLGESGSGRDALGFDILLHCGSLFAILIGFRDVWLRVLRGIFRREAQSWHVVLYVCIATIPGVIAGLLFEDAVANMRSLTAAAVGFLVTSLFLVAGEWFGRSRSRDRIGSGGALFIGLAQAAAILPGVSRSGLTVSTARALGMKRDHALDFSFLMALPIIAGAVAKTGLDAFDGAVAFPVLSVSFAGFTTSLIVSLGAVAFLRRFALRNSFAWFAWYLVPLSLVLLADDWGLVAWIDAPHAREAVRGFGSLAVFLFAFVEVIPPFCFISPGMSALVIAGSLAPDPLSLSFFIAAAVTASFAGNIVLYVAGRVAGPSLERAMRISETNRMRAESFVHRAGAWAVAGGQFTSMFRPTVAFVAGALFMPWIRFCVAAFLGAVAWGTTSLVAGYVLREHIGVVLWVLGSVGAFVLFCAGVFVIVEWFRMKRRLNA